MVAVFCGICFMMDTVATSGYTFSLIVVAVLEMRISLGSLPHCQR